MNAEARLAALRRRLHDEGVQAILVTDVANMRYVTGFEGVIDEDINAACLVTAEIARFYTDFRYQEAAEAAAEGTPWFVHVVSDGLYIELTTMLNDSDIGCLAVESSVPYGRFRYLSEKLGGDVRAVESWVEELRQTKDPHEIERVRQAAALTDRAFSHVLPFLKVGVTERDIALEIEFFMRREGSEGVAFAPIVASGPNSARPHAQVSDRAIGDGDFVKMDFGARLGGYCSDMTRTVVVGKASERQRTVYEAVLAANLAALEEVRPGLTGSALHDVAVGVLSERGFADRFGHGLGHGVGLEVHELPHIAPRGRTPVRAGSVITIEPGVYLPGFGGVRIEDLVVVDESGASVLSRAPKDLIEL